MNLSYLDKNKKFKGIIQLIFYLSILISFLFIVMRNYWVILWVFLFWMFIILVPYKFLFKKKDIEHAFNDFFNIVDGPIDKIKEKIHGAHLPFGYEINISFLMKNRKTTWNIIRKQGNYCNEDIEDLPEGFTEEDCNSKKRNDN